jgi:P4 family phage/plasmid primase-like protien
MPEWMVARLKVVGRSKPVPRAAEFSLGADVSPAARALEQLADWRCNDYQAWIEVGMALSELGDVGLALWDTWSRKSKKYSPGVCQEKWGTFEPGNGITLASLYRWAKQDNSSITPASHREHLTDLGNARRLVQRYGADLRYCDPIGGWLYWDGRRWALDTTGVAVRMAKDVVRSIYAEAAQGTSDDARKGIAKWAMGSESASRIRGMLELARTEPEVIVEVADFDTNPWLLNCQNGTVDLRTGTLRPHDRRDLITKLAPVEFDPQAAGPHWQAHLERFLPNAAIRRQVQRDLGLSLVGADLEEMLPIWYGTGGNGKTTTANAIQGALGNYAMQAAPDLLMLRKYDSHPTELADLRGSRAVFSAEVAEGRRLDEARVKRLTGGDPLKGRFMGHDFFEFPHTWTIILLVNHRPIITGTDNAIWRRVRLIPWTVTIEATPDERRPQAEVLAELEAERPAILRWLLEGLADWRADPHWRAEEVRVATERYRQEQDRLAGFLADCCELGPNYTVEVAELYETYTTWCADAGEEPVGKTQFGGLIRNRGIDQKKQAHGVRKWTGVRLKVANGGNVSRSSSEKKEIAIDLESLPPNATFHGGPLQTSVDDIAAQEFQPSRDWQDLPDGYACPPGVEWRSNLSTGTNQVRWPQVEPTPVEKEYLDLADTNSGVP